jgi:ferric-dicitrate binding protein FerR (iron transport regulator)
VSSDVDEATEWLEAIKAYGVGGPVVKGASTRYQPGRRDWVKGNSLGCTVFGPISLWVLSEVSALCGVRGRCATGVAERRHRR